MRLPYLSEARHFTLLRNSLDDWAVAIGVGVAATLAILFLRGLVLRRLAARASPTSVLLDDFAGAMLSRTYLVFILAFACYLGSTFLDLTARQERVVMRIGVAALLLQAAIWADTGLRAWRDQYRFGHTTDGERRASSSVLCFISRLVLWAIVTLMILDNFGINITTLVASLGIGGVAVALATQNILGDLFASLSIMLDKPFEVGDFIIVGDVLGSVEHIGLKTTRLRGLGGEQVVFSNGELLKSRIHNHKRMQTRRVAFVLRIAYGTSEELLCRIPQIIREVITTKPDVDFERAHLFQWGEWSLNFEVVYHFRSPDYRLHMDAQQAIFLEIYRRFQQEQIAFAHPMSIVRLDDPALASFAHARRDGAPPSGTAVH
ncbi:mechanosensitive ion channel family protein [uncultured Massilia sp.]|uniref:mechanosensitive ion channel family protein n=1 Tax=uncultured Massilia sp. TaxID=169973 RepID=UPI0025D3BEA4|nr:mechanosensitive ion channel family protein [uncultured Massilia sp.]